MENSLTPRYQSYSTEIAAASFGIGTLILGAHLLFPDWLEIFIIGMVYVVSAILINLIVLLNLIFNGILYPAERQAIAIRILIVLANIPIAFFYFCIVTKTL